MIKAHQLMLAILCKVTHDSRVNDTASRDYLVKTGYVSRKFGWNVVTPWGAQVAENLKLIKP